MGTGLDVYRMSSYQHCNSQIIAEQASNRARASPEPDPPGAEGVGLPKGAGVRVLGKYGRPAPEG